MISYCFLHFNYFNLDFKFDYVYQPMIPNVRNTSCTSDKQKTTSPLLCHGETVSLLITATVKIFYQIFEHYYWDKTI